MIRAHLRRWRPRPHAQRTGSTPRVRPSGAALQLDPSHRSSQGFSDTLLVIVPVVDVGIMPMAMAHRQVNVPVGVGLARRFRAVMGMLMVFIVRVPVLVR